MKDRRVPVEQNKTYYKVMLVDDEQAVRDAIARKLEWEEIGFQVVAMAENGEDALEKAETFAPDVVMTDISMPFMDGLTFCRKLKEQMPWTRIIIFSGYDEFEYAKEAIKLEVEEYILKPIDSDELQQIFLRLKQSLDEELDRRRNADRLKRYYQESLPVLKDQFLIGLLEGRISDHGLMKYYIDEYGLALESAFYMVGVIQMKMGQEETDSDSSLLSFSLKQIVDEELNQKIDFYSVNYMGTIVVIALLNDAAAAQRFVTMMNRNCKLARKMLGKDTSAGVGKLYDQLRHVCDSYKEAKEAMAYRIFLEPNQAVSILDVEPENPSMVFHKDDLIRDIVREIKIGTREKLESDIQLFTESLKETTITRGQLQLLLAELQIELMKLGRSYQLDATVSGILLGKNLWDELERFVSMNELEQWLLEQCLCIRSAIRQERTSMTKVLTDKALAYVAENYADSGLSIDRICSHLGVSEAYFYSIFKKEMGMSFVAYLTKIRMEQAVYLLNTTQEKSYVIAGMVGYEEPNYFSYVFKKYYGSSPSKYRKNKEAAEHEKK